MARRITLSTVLLAGTATLIVAISVGNAMGNRVLGQIGRATGVSATPVAIATAETAASGARNWKHVSLASVATDPAFPDPRITPPPPPTPPPEPTRRPATPTPAPKPSDEPTPVATFDYTSPPLPLPLVTEPEATPTAPAPVETPVAVPTGTPLGARPRAVPTTKMTPNAVGP